MLHATLLLEDTTVVATRDLPDEAGTVHSPGMWTVIVSDNLTGKHGMCLLDDVDWGLLLMLSAGLGESNTLPDIVIRDAYARLGPKIAYLPAECRPIP